MSVKVEASHDGVPHNTVMIIGGLIALVSLYIAMVGETILKVDTLAFFGGIAVVGALIWGNSTIKRLCSYGIGTGVPSAGMLAFGAGTVAFVAGSIFLTKTYGIWIIPIGVLVLALILGFIFGWIANSVENMKIPVMVRSIAELSMVGAISLAGFAVLATGKISFNELSGFIGAGIIAVGFMLGAIALQHPFNACLGPGEKQDRTNMLAIACGFLSMLVMAVISFAFLSAKAAVISLVIAIVGWLIAYLKYIKLSKRDAAAWLDAKPFEDVEE